MARVVTSISMPHEWYVYMSGNRISASDVVQNYLKMHSGGLVND